MQTTRNQAVIVSTDVFRQGYAQGIRGVYRGGFLLPEQPTEEAVVSLIRNLCELAAEGNLNEAQLKYDAGILTGYLIATIG